MSHSANEGGSLPAVPGSTQELPAPSAPPPLTGAGAGCSLADLALIRADQRQRWRGGECVLVEDYLERFPALRALPEAVVDLLCNEILLREEAGASPSSAEYRERFPGCAEAVARQLSLHRAAATGALEAALGQMPPALHPSLLPLTRDSALLPGRRRSGSTLPGTEGSAPTTPTVPVRLDIPGYEVLSKIGEGGMGVVYKARQLSLKRLVALKMIKAGASAGADQLARFRSEAEAIARLQHPNIVQVYEVGEHGDCPYYSLEFIEGGSLDRKLNGLPQPPVQAAQLTETLARAVHAAHEKGIVHRDLKPANVLLAVDGTPKVTDFGLAKQLDDDSWKTHSGVILGTPPYMAPEQAEGRAREIGPATDVYALGAILYEALTGRPPFKAATAMETIWQVISQEPVEPRRLQPNTPRDLETICLKCLRKEWSRRYASATELANDLHRFLAGEPIQARPVRTWERAVKWARRHPAGTALIGVSAAALLGLAAAGFLYQDQRARTAEAEARQARQELSDRARQDEVRQRVLTGQKAVAERDWSRAKAVLDQAWVLMRPEDVTLDEVREQARDLLRQADQGVAVEKARQEAQARLQQFQRLRNDALFHATLATGEGLAANLRATRTAVQDALAVFGIAIEGRTPPTLDAGLSAADRSNVLDGCYELLLVLAEAEAQDAAPRADRPADLPLRVLDRAGRLGCPTTQAFHLRRARYLEMLGRAADAGKERDLAKARPPAKALDHYLLGDERYKQGELPEAVHEFENALRLQPDHFWARYFLSVAYLRLGRPAEAKAHLTACLSRQSGFTWLYLMRGFAHSRLEEWADAEADFRRAEELIGQAEEGGQRTEKDARQVLYANRGALWLQRGDRKKAIADLEKAVALKPGEYQARLTLAQVYQGEGRWDDAIRQLDEAIKKEADLPLLYRLRAGLHQARPQPDLAAALRDLDKVIALESRAGPSKNLARAHAARGRLLQRSNRYPEAVAAYDAALKAHPNHAEAHLGRAEAQRRLGKYAEALHSFDLYLVHGGKPLPDVYRARGWARAQLNDFAGAVQDYGLALEKQPGDVATRLARARAYLACESYQLALADFDEAVRREPQAAEAHSGRGYALARLDRHREAVEDAKAALRGMPDAGRLYDAARIYALATATSLRSVREDRAAAQEAPRYQRAALEMLRQAVQATPAKERRAFVRERVVRDAALASIRHLPAFAELVAPYGTSGR